MMRPLRSCRLRATDFFRAAGKAKQVSTSRRVPSHALSTRSPRARWHEHGARVPGARGGQLSHGCPLSDAWLLRGGGVQRAQDVRLPVCGDLLLPLTWLFLSTLGCAICTLG